MSDFNICHRKINRTNVIHTIKCYEAVHLQKILNTVLTLGFFMSNLFHIKLNAAKLLLRY